MAQEHIKDSDGVNGTHKVLPRLGNNVGHEVGAIIAVKHSDLRRHGPSMATWKASSPTTRWLPMMSRASMMNSAS